MWLKWIWLLISETWKLFRCELRKAQQGVIVAFWIVTLTEIFFAYTRFTGFQIERSLVYGFVHSVLFGSFAIGSVYLIQSWAWINFTHQRAEQFRANEEIRMAAARSVIQDVTSMFKNLPENATVSIEPTRDTKQIESRLIPEHMSNPRYCEYLNNGFCYYCCEICNTMQHRCGCGEEVNHNRRNYDGSEHIC